jgi:hypothetical protein
MPPSIASELNELDFTKLIGGPLTSVIDAQTKAAQATANFIKTVGFKPNGQPIYVDFKYPKEIQPCTPGKTIYQVDKVSIIGGAGGGLGGGTGYTTNSRITFSQSDIDPSKTATAIVATASLIVPAVASTATAASGGVISAITVTNAGLYLNPPSITIDAPAAATDLPCSLEVVMKTYSTESAKPAIYQEMKISVPILTIVPIPYITIDRVTIDFNAKINSVETRSESESIDASGRVGLELFKVLSVSATFAYKKSTTSGSTVERTYSMSVHVEASQGEMPYGMEKILNILENAMIATPTSPAPKTRALFTSPQEMKIA